MLLGYKKINIGKSTFKRLKLFSNNTFGKMFFVNSSEDLKMIVPL